MQHHQLSETIKHHQYFSQAHQAGALNFRCSLRVNLVSEQELYRFEGVSKV